jgi:hypothetical protein
LYVSHRHASAPAALFQANTDPRLKIRMYFNRRSKKIHSEGGKHDKRGGGM